MGSRGAKVTGDPEEAARVVAGGSPVVLVNEDPSALGAAVSASPDNGRRERLLGVMVGDLEDPAVMSASAEMASELWPWAGTPARATPDPATG
ncbi:MAG TPA: hypothetical protein VEJ84_02770 [Acidimicrobiales bacterium]|nr:hypothetical protein [Acidimicrobiales bacterium]